MMLSFCAVMRKPRACSARTDGAVGASDTPRACCTRAARRAAPPHETHAAPGRWHARTVVCGTLRSAWNSLVFDRLYLRCEEDERGARVGRASACGSRRARGACWRRVPIHKAIARAPPGHVLELHRVHPAAVVQVPGRVAWARGSRGRDGVAQRARQPRRRLATRDGPAAPAAAHTHRTNWLLETCSGKLLLVTSLDAKPYALSDK